MEFLEKWVYDLPATPPKTRTKPMKILALGLSRSGTESLQRGLRMLGYDHVYHGFDMVSGPDEWRKWTVLGRRKYGTRTAAKDGDSGLTEDDFDVLLGHCEAVTDQPCALFARELIRAYPEALVILNHRDVHSWYPSACNVFTPLLTGLLYHVLFWFNANLYWENRYAKECFQEYFHGSLRQHGKWVYEEHCAKVRGLVPPDRLLEWKVQDGWEPLCKFLGKETPPEPFPSGNKPADTLGRFNLTMGKFVSAANRNFLICLACTGGVVTYAVYKLAVI